MSLLKILSSFGEDEPEAAGLPPPSLKTLVIVNTVIKMVIERALIIENIVKPCSRNKVRILSIKDASLSRTFLMVCLILATCV